MIHHLDIAVRDIERSERFYTQSLKPLGMSLMVRNASNRLGGVTIGFGNTPDPVFWIRSDPPASERVHLAFSAPSRAAVDSFYLAALDAGGTDNGAPALRPQYGVGYYAAFVVDPDGHNIEAVHRDVL